MDVAEVLRSSGFRVTVAREAVWEVLRRASSHLTAEEIHERARQRAPEVNLASVYRTLGLLAELDLVHEVALNDGRGRWEVAHPAAQVHLVCRSCDVIEHHPADALEALQSHLTDGHGFVPEVAEVVVYGLCARCAAGP